MRDDRIKLKAKEEHEFVLKLASLARGHRSDPDTGVAAVQEFITKKKLLTDEQNLAWISRGAIPKEFATTILDLLVDLVFLSQPQTCQAFPDVIEKWLDRNLGLVLKTYFENEALGVCEEMIFDPYTNLGWVMRNDEAEEHRRDRRWSFDEVHAFVHELYGPYLCGQQARRPIGATLHSSKFKLHWLGIPKTSAHKSYELHFVKMGTDKPRQKVVCSPGFVAGKIQDKISAVVSEPIFLLVKPSGESTKSSEETDSTHGPRFAGDVYCVEGESRTAKEVTSSDLKGDTLAFSLLSHVFDRLAYHAPRDQLRAIYKCEFEQVPYFRHKTEIFKKFAEATSRINTFFGKLENPNLVWKSAGYGLHAMSVAFPFLVIIVKPSSKPVSSDSCVEEEL